MLFKRIGENYRFRLIQLKPRVSIIIKKLTLQLKIIRMFLILIIIIGTSFIGTSFIGTSFNGCPPPGPQRPTYLTASPRSDISILLSWKDNSHNEGGFRIERKQNDDELFEIIAEPPQNTRYYLDNELTLGTTYHYRVRSFLETRESRSSNLATATTDSINSIAQHSNGLEVDNQGGGANGWSHFDILGYDQLYDGHLQIWIVGDEKVYDGDDLADFSSSTDITLYKPAIGRNYEHTAAISSPNDPVIIQCHGEDIEIRQFTYQPVNKRWVLIEWSVYNGGSTNKNVKLGLFLDADAGGELSIRDQGGFIDNEDYKLVYLQNESSDKCVGMALISDISYYENYQINSFRDYRTPDNSAGNGERARLELFNGNEEYTGTISNITEDLTMTLVSSLGEIGTGGSIKVKYVIAAGIDLADLQNSINDAINFAQSISLFI